LAGVQAGAVKVAFCRRLGSSWRELADVLGIPSHDAGSFEPGDEPRAVWRWLQDRDRLEELPRALTAIDRPDLGTLLREGWAGPGHVEEGSPGQRARQVVSGSSAGVNIIQIGDVSGDVDIR